MKYLPFRPAWWKPLLWAAAVVVVLSTALAPRQGSAIARPALNAALLATVRVAVPVAGEKDSYSTGSGTVLTADGLVLTNFHVMGDTEDEKLYNRGGVAYIGVNPTNLRGEPIWKYTATLVRGSADLDLAVLRIDGLMDEKGGKLPANLGLAPIPMGASENVQIGDEINVFGFPGIGQGTVTFTSGSISGFLDEDSDSVMEWFKTDATVARGNSGGLATDANGKMIGIPTAGIADTETASSINLIRPVELALPLVRAAANQTGASQGGSGEQPVAASGEAVVGEVIFATAIDRQDQPIKPGLRFASSTTTIYAVFQYAGFVEGQTFEYVWYRNSKEIFRDSMTWEGDPEGNNWVNIYSEKALGDGFYELELLFDDASIHRSAFVIGSRVPAKVGAFGPITFASTITSDAEPVDPGDTFSNTSEMYAFFDVKSVPNGVVWTRKWYVDDELILESSRVWDGGNAPAWFISIQAADGLSPGQYRLELLIEGKIVQRGEFEIVESGASEVEGVIVVGVITTEDNKRKPIEGASVFFLTPGVTVAEFLEALDESLIYAYGITDAKGQYQLNNPVVPGESYGVVIYHEKYRLVSQDDFEIDPDAQSPWQIDITMKKR